MAGDDEIAFLAFPAVTEIDIERRWSGLLIQLRQLRLVVLLKYLDRADVISEDPNVPFISIEIRERDSGIVLDDGFAVIENKIPDPVESIFEHQVGGRLEKTAAYPKPLAKPEKTRGRRNPAIGNVSSKIVEGLFLA